jgi:alkanesulfonate monooxygenase SsuD/methylene tetrahydromethanopterin reductase-like flavin-dependent oxidoreductase (luciferase family)
MEWGVAINLRESVSEIIERAVAADQGGIHTIWLTDFPATRFSPALAAVVAESTTNSRIGVGLLSPLIYSPPHIVQMMTTLIETYGDRFDLLLGPGDRTKLEEIGISYGQISTIVDRMIDAFTSIREGLSDNKNCRIFVGAQGSKMVEAATCVDGVLLNYSDPEMIQWAISILEERPDNFMIGIFPPSLIGTSKKCEETTSIKTSAAVVALGVNRSTLKKFGLLKELTPARDMVKKEGLTEKVVDMIDQKILDRFSFCGSNEEIVDRLVDYQRLGVDIVVYGPPQGATLRGINSLVKVKKDFQNS